MSLIGQFSVPILDSEPLKGSRGGEKENIWRENANLQTSVSLCLRIASPRLASPLLRIPCAPTLTLT